MTSLLEVRNLRVSFPAGRARREVLHGIDLTLAQGEVLGLIGESGSGKTVTGMSLLRLLPETALITADRLAFDGEELLGLSERRFAPLRGRRMATIFQDPAGAFNPCKTIGWHLVRALGRERGGADATSLLHDVGIADPARVLRSYPHQLSGGMLQRALIAIVVALRPRLIVADEPTTNLDNIVERQILSLIAKHCHAIGAAVLFITHDLTIARDICDRIAVLYGGELVELGPAEDILARPLHPYTDALLRTARSLAAREPRLHEIPGEIVPMAHAPDCCVFTGRCPAVMSRCRSAHPALAPHGERSVRCFLHD